VVLVRLTEMARQLGPPPHRNWMNMLCQATGTALDGEHRPVSGVGGTAAAVHGVAASGSGGGVGRAAVAGGGVGPAAGAMKAGGGHGTGEGATSTGAGASNGDGVVGGITEGAAEDSCAPPQEKKAKLSE
jgi:hypothetical protein